MEKYVVYYFNYLLKFTWKIEAFYVTDKLNNVKNHVELFREKCITEHLH